MILVEYLLGAMALVVLVPAAVLLVEVLAALRPGTGEEIPGGRHPAVAVLVPAHNEAQGLGATLGSILAQLTPPDRLVVVADNCTDATARVAAAAGAEVVERHDPGRRGKGYALDFGIRHLSADPPDVVIVVDADCLVGPGSLQRLATLCEARKRPVQACYLMQAAEGAGVQARVAEFAWLLKNCIRPLGALRLGLPCQLMGSGMALPWGAIRTAPLTLDSLVEDLALGIQTARSGPGPMFCPEASVVSQFAKGRPGALQQRTRWEHGHLAAILAYVPRLLPRAVAEGNAGLAFLLVDLSVPPLALLGLLTCAVLACAIALFIHSAVAWPAIVAAAAFVVLAGAGVLAWAAFGRKLLSLGELTLALCYATAKVPLYARFLVRRQIEWVRARREGDS